MTQLALGTGTLETEEYPTRYVAWENPRTWVLNTKRGTPELGIGHEAAVYADKMVSEGEHGGLPCGIYVEIVYCQDWTSTLKHYGPGATFYWLMDGQCEDTTQHRNQHGRMRKCPTFEAAMDEANAFIRDSEAIIAKARAT
jgi:hypothetical protein